MADLAGFTTFVRTTMGISTTVLPDSAEWIGDAFNWSVEVVNDALQSISSLLYDQAVYNLAGDILLNIAQDQPGQTFFATARQTFGLNTFVAGVIQASSDEATSNTKLVPDFFKDLTLGNLANLKTPYGRTYLAIAQTYGPLWGLS